jgi:hypothetical protein
MLSTGFNIAVKMSKLEKTLQSLQMSQRSPSGFSYVTRQYM